MMLSFGDPLIFIQRPISATLLGLAVILIAVIALPSLRKRRQETFAEAG
jgi:putative tricarboxylic transport membrane protein